MDPAEGAGGDSIVLTGTHLGETTDVLFGISRGWNGKPTADDWYWGMHKPALFRIVSERTLEVVVPDFIRWNAEAIVVVVGRDGVTVTSPATADVVRTPLDLNDAVPATELRSPLVRVLRRGMSLQTRQVTAIDQGAVVKLQTDSPFAFVKSGGTLQEARFVGAVFLEKGAVLESQWPSQEGIDDVRCNVSEICISEGVGPFVYRRRPAVPAGVQAPPEISGVSPLISQPAGVVVVRGQHLASTKEVWFKQIGGKFLRAEFDIVSAAEVRLEVPDMYPAECQILLLTAHGLAVAAGPFGPAPATANGIVEISQPASDARKLKGAVLVVQPSGALEAADQDSVILIKAGGKLAPELESRSMFYEKHPDFDLPEINPNLQQVRREVETINVFPIKRCLDVSRIQLSTWEAEGKD